MSARSDGPAVAGVERLDRVRRANDPADLDVVFEERHEFRPGEFPELHDRRIPATPLGGEALGIGPSQPDLAQLIAVDRMPIAAALPSARVASAWTELSSLECLDLDFDFDLKG